jgi:transcriptional regulator with XRE-family HTH domain
VSHWRDHGRPWTSVDVDRLRELAEAGGLSRTAMAEKLGRSLQATNTAMVVHAIKRPLPSLGERVLAAHSHLVGSGCSHPSPTEVGAWVGCSAEAALRWLVENDLDHSATEFKTGAVLHPDPLSPRTGTPIVGSYGAFDRSGFCDRTDKAMSELDASETRLAIAVGIRLGRKISRQYISKIKRGYRSPGKINFELANAIAHVLGFDIWEFIDTSQADDAP